MASRKLVDTSAPVSKRQHIEIGFGGEKSRLLASVARSRAPPRPPLLPSAWVTEPGLARHQAMPAHRHHRHAARRMTDEREDLAFQRCCQRGDVAQEIAPAG